LTKPFVHSLLGLFALSILLNFGACKEDPPAPQPVEKDPIVSIRSELVSQGSVYSIDDEFTDAEGNRVKLVALKFYLADITFIDDNGGRAAVSEIELFDHKPIDAAITTPQWPNVYSYTLPKGTYSAIEFGLGVPGDLNGIDPATYDNDEALSIYSNMYWSWASMYRFVILEAKMDTTGGDNFDHDVIFHMGLDQLYRPNIERKVLFSAEMDSESEVVLQLDWEMVFYQGDEAIDIRSENITHTADNAEDLDLAARFTNNLVQAISVKQ